MAAEIQIDETIERLLSSKQPAPDVTMLTKELIQQAGGYQALAAEVWAEYGASKRGSSGRALLMRSILDMVKNATPKTPVDPAADLPQEEMQALLKKVIGG